MRGRRTPTAPAIEPRAGTPSVRPVLKQAPGGDRLRRVAKPLLWILALLPLAGLVWDGFTGGLGAEPIEEVTHRTGEAAIRLLMATLAVTPVRRFSGWNWLVQLRRPLGLFAFFYATLHFATYLFDQFFSLPFIVEDILERPFITVGFVAWLLLIPLALTSTRGMIRRLGKRWQRLHRLVYAIAILGVLHFIWGVKGNELEPWIYAGALALLLALRLPVFRMRRISS